MDPQTFMDIATVVTKLKMYPYFDIANYILMSMMVRDDNPTQGTGSTLFSRKHPLACWVSTMLMCFAGSILGNLLIGEPLLVPFKNHQDVITASVVWYLINYSPFDLVYKVTRFLPFKLVIYCLKEVQRANKIHHGIILASKLYPGSYVIIALIGVVKGAGYYYMRTLERFVRGLWVPASNEILQPSFVSKGSLAASIVFILERKGFISAPHAAIYFGVVIFFIYFRLSSLLLGIHDPFVPFENLFCAVFMGGMWDALKRAMTREKRTDEDANSVKNNLKASHEEKKTQ
eukprot:GHVU01107110.1.p1 GENE.GHVU01107110.1~~GHVU01107110.1.p1  ORF type:complete len:289 (+),score=26.27 GHVU01107110.1:87-953(+)